MLSRIRNSEQFAAIILLKMFRDKLREQCPDGWFSIGTDSLGYPRPLKIALRAAARFCETLMLPRHQK